MIRREYTHTSAAASSPLGARAGPPSAAAAALMVSVDLYNPPLQQQDQAFSRGGIEPDGEVLPRLAVGAIAFYFKIL